MSKFDQCKSIIVQVGNEITSLETSLYIFAESQSCGNENYHSHTLWQWNKKEVHIKEVGVHPCLS